MTENSVYPVSMIRSMKMDNYFGKKINGIIRNWVMDALDKNPNLIGAVAFAASTGKGLEDSGCKGLISDQMELLGKHLTGIAELYRIVPDEKLKYAGDDLVSRLDAARGKDGYLGVRSISARMRRGTWDLWGHYHAIYGLIQWYRVTGSSLSRKIAIETADYCLRTFSDGASYAIGSEFSNYSICHAYTILYQETGDDKYLREAHRIIDEDWPKHGNWFRDALEGKEFFESTEPRWESLHSVMALGALFEISGDKQYMKALDHIWWSILKTDRHNTGAFATYEKAVGQPYDNDGLETCACVAWAALSTEYLRFTRNAYVADEIELTCYNTLSGALMDNMRQVTYTTPMDGRRISTQESLDWAYNTGIPDLNCCQANACRSQGIFSIWASMTSDSGIFINFYGRNTMETITPGGQKIRLATESEYPVNGHITIRIDEMEVPEQFALCLRIPSWSRGSSVTLMNGEKTEAVSGTYYEICQNWKKGDSIRLDIGMTTHFWVGEGRLAEKMSVYYGPVLLAMDERFEKRNPDTVFFTGEELRAAPVQNDRENDCMLCRYVNDENGHTVKLIDFASAGKERSSYRSWLNVRKDGKLCQSDMYKGPIWQYGLD